MKLPHALLDALVESVLVFDDSARLVHANQAALRRLPCEPGMNLADLGPALGQPLQDRLRAVLAGGRIEAYFPAGVSAGSAPSLSRLDSGPWVLCLPPEGSAVTLPRTPLTLIERPLRELRALLWTAPFPAMLQDDSFRLLDVNDAFVALTGRAREALIGTDPIALCPADERRVTQEDRERLEREPGEFIGPALRESRLVDSDGRSRWVRSTRYATGGGAIGGRRLLMTVLQETTSEHVAREQAERFSRELDQWFDLSPMGMALFDDRGLVLRANQGFEALSGGPLVDLSEAAAPLHRLLNWSQGAMVQPLSPGGAWVSSEGALPHADGRTRWVRALLRCDEVRAGRRRYMCMLEDRSAEDERDLAQARAEQLLGELSTILDSSPAGIASVRGHLLTQCNSRFERMLGLAQGAASGCDIRALLAGGTQEPLDRLDAVLDRGELYETEVVVQDEDGAWHWYAVTIRRTGPAGRMPLAIVVLSEITRLKTQQAELAHLASEHERMAGVLGQQADRTRAVLDSVLVGIVTADEQGRISWLNRSARRMFGGDLGDFMGQPLHTVATDETDHPFRRTVPLFGELRDGEALQFECRVQARDARTFWVVGNAVATLGLQGEREMTFALMDIDQRRQAEARIAEAQASLQRIIEAAPMAITVCDAATLRVLQLNRAAAALCSVSAPDAVGRSLVLLHPQPVGASLQSDIDEALAQPQVVTPREYRLVRDGRTEIWDARFLPLARSEDRVDQLLMVSTDVTTQREAQRAELEAAIARREMLVQEVHHRIKNNLQGVAGLMQQAVVRYPQVQPIIAEVVGQVQAIAQVYGLQVGNTGLLAVRSVIEAIAQSVQRTFGRAIELTVEGDPGWRWLLPEAESIPIALALNELFTNAIKHSPASSGVVCRLWLEPEAVRVEICNQGRLPADFRLDRRPATVSGLGLVSALLPRRSASLVLTQQDDTVVAALRLAPPVVRCERATP
ncbi:PAS domain S-box protein [Sphaerotilus sp.]|uniref:PAS domain S-box protein n=1 Tax=Sphaerotilus sp. TaxID=2093942 RepID=UPI00286DA543|nr:PAS domain S-box protein [Sphaerotilus sp.]